MNKENRRKIIYGFLRLTLFAAVFVVSFLGFEKLFYSDVKTNPVWKYAVREGHAPIDILFVGNSHTYASVDGKLLSDATGLNIRELTCASVNGVNVAADLEAFLHYEVPTVVVVELCPFATNATEMRKENLGILFAHFDGIPDRGIQLHALSRMVPWEDVPAGLFQLLRSALMWDRWSRDKEASRAFDEYGAHRLFDVEFSTSFFPNTVAKAYSTPSEGGTGLLPQNTEAFLSVIDLAERCGFELWIYNAPTYFYNQNYVDMLRMADSLREEHPCIRYIDNSMLYLNEIGIDRTDFYDMYHLNLDGMEKTSVWLGEKIAERFHTGFDTDSILQYKGCSVTMLENGRYCYEYETFCAGRHRFTYTKDGEEHDTGLTDANRFEEGALSEEEMKTLSVVSRTAQKGGTDMIRHRFLPLTIERYEVQILNGGILLRNKSNFRGDLDFAWQVTKKGMTVETGYGEEEAEAEPFRHTNEIFLPFHESGTYDIRAITRQQSDGVSRATDILTVSYDAGIDRIIIEKAAECVTVE